MRTEYVLAAILTAQASIAYAATLNLSEQLPEFWLLTVVSGMAGGTAQFVWSYQNSGMRLWPAGVMTIALGAIVAGFVSPIGHALVGGLLDGADLVGASRAMVLGFIVGVLGMDVVGIITAFSNQRRRQAEGERDEPRDQ